MFAISLDVVGLEPLADLLHTWKAFGSKARSVELHPIPRADGAATNAELLNWHAEGEGRNPKRDFITPSAANLEAIARAAVEAAEIEAKKQHKRALGYEKRRAKSKRGKYTTRTGKVKKLGKPPNLEKLANQLAAKTLKAAMLEYMDGVKMRIHAVRSNTGDIPDYSSDYRDKKLKAVGFINPKLVFTGQLLDNLDTGGTAVKNVRVRRGKSTLRVIGRFSSILQSLK